MSGKKDAIVVPLPSEGECVALLGEGNEVKGYINSRRPRHFKEGTFLITFQHGLEWLSEQDLKGMELKILLRVMSQLDFDNYWRIEQKELSEKMGINKSHISSALKKFVEMGILYKGPNAGKSRTYRLNPNIAHKGAKNYKKTVADFRSYQKAKEGKAVETTIVTD